MFYFSQSLIVLLSFFWTPFLFGFQIPEMPKTYVSDHAGVLDSASKQKLEQLLSSFEKQTSNQVIVATFPSLEGENIEELSMRIAEKWKVGQKDKDNGVILLVFKNDRKLRIEVGYGLEAVLTDSLSKRIIQNEIVPRFKQGDFSGGILAGVSAILKASQGEYQGKETSNEGIDLGKGGALLLFLLIFFLPYFLRRSRSNSIDFGSGAWSSGSSWGSGRSGGFSGGGGGFGGGGSSGSW